MEPNWEQIKCPLCGDEAGPGKIAITTHLSRHLEEISLSALPVALDSKTNSEASESDIDNNDQVNQDSEEEPQDFEAIALPYLASPSMKPLSGPAASEEGPFKARHEWQLEGQAQKENAMSREKQKQAVQLPHDPEIQIHNGKEAAFHRRMGEMKNAQEEAKREAEKARIDAEEAANQRLTTEQEAKEEERARLYAQAVAATEEALYKRVKAESVEEDRLRAELKTMEARRQAETEARDKAEAEAKAKMLNVVKDALRHQREIEKAGIDAERVARERLEAREKYETEMRAEERARLQFEAALNSPNARQQVEAVEVQLMVDAALKAAKSDASDKTGGVEHMWICSNCVFCSRMSAGGVCINCNHYYDASVDSLYIRPQSPRASQQRQSQTTPQDLKKQCPQEQLGDSYDDQAKSPSQERAPRTEQEPNPKNEGYSATDNHINKPNKVTANNPSYSNLIEHSVGIEAHTTALKKN